MNPEGFEPLARLLLIIVGLVVAAGVIGIIMAVAGLITGGIAIFSGGASKIGLIVASVLLTYGGLALSSIFWEDSLESFLYERREISEYTPLMRAVYKQNVRKVRKLLKKGKDPNETRAGYSPLILACKQPNDEKSDEIVHLLLEANADPNLKVFYDDGEKFRLPLKDALGMNRREAVKNLALHGALLDSIDRNTNEPLDFMPVQYVLGANYGLAQNKELARILMENGANPGFFMYQHSDYKKFTLIMRLLSHSSETDKELETTLYLLEEFLKLGGNVNEKNEKGWTAMHYCASVMGYNAKNLPLGEKLAAYGADLNARNDEGMTPLMVMLDEGAGAIEERPALVEFLISHGADITIKDNEGKIALEQFIEQYGLSKNYYYSHEEKKAAYDRIIELLTPKKAGLKAGDMPKTAERIESTEPVEDAKTVVAKANFMEEKHTELADIADNW